MLRKSGGKVVRQRAHARSMNRVTVGSSRVSPNYATDNVLEVWTGPSKSWRWYIFFNDMRRLL